VAINGYFSVLVFHYSKLAISFSPSAFLSGAAALQIRQLFGKTEQLNFRPLHRLQRYSCCKSSLKLPECDFEIFLDCRHD